MHEGDRPHGHGVPAVVLQDVPSREVSGKGSLPGDQDVRPGAGGDSGIHRQALHAPGLGVPDRFGFESHVKCRGSAFEHDLHRAGPHRIDVESGEQEAGLQLALHMGTGPTGSRPHRLGAAAPPFQKVVSNQCQVHVPVSGAVEGRRGIRKPARGQGLLDGAGPIPEVQGPLDVALDEIPVQRRGKDVRIAPAAKGKPPHGERGSILSGRSETGLRDPTGIQQVNVGPPRGQAGLLIQGELAGARQVSEQGQLRIEHEGRTAAEDIELDRPGAGSGPLCCHVHPAVLGVQSCLLRGRSNRPRSGPIGGDGGHVRFRGPPGHGSVERQIQLMVGDEEVRGNHRIQVDGPLLRCPCALERGWFSRGTGQFRVHRHGFGNLGSAPFRGNIQSRPSEGKTGLEGHLSRSGRKGGKQP